MKFVGILAVIFAALNFKAIADDLALSDNPYAPVVERNIFGLVPIPVPSPQDTKPPDPPSKITPNGIMNLFGQLQVLFKVSVPPKLGLPPHDQSYTMSVGERLDGIEVTRIDKEAGMITFNNHGVIQELALSKIATSSAAPSQPAQLSTLGLKPPMMNNNRWRQGQNNFQSSGENSATAHAYGNNASAPSYGAVPTYGSASATGNNNSQEQLSPEAQVLVMEAQRAKWQQEGNSAAAIIPPTAITSQLQENNGGGGPPAP